MWTSDPRQRLEVSPGFWLMAAVVFWLDEGVGFLPWGVLACILHEAGHVAAAAVFGGRVGRLRLSATGAEFTMVYDAPLSYGRESLVLLAGPATNLLVGGMAAAGKCYLLAAMNFAVGGFNLLPVLPLDGGRLLFDLLADLLDPDWAERFLTAAAGVLTGLLVGIGMILAANGLNFTLLVTALWLLLCTIRGDSGAGRRPVL